MEQCGSQKLLQHAISVLLRRDCGLSLVVQYSVNNWNWLDWRPVSLFSKSSDKIERKNADLILKTDTLLPEFVEQSNLSFWFCLSFSLLPSLLGLCSSQVDLLVPTKVTGIITQGAKDFGHVQFVGSYKVAFSNDGEQWNVYQDEKQGKDKVSCFYTTYWFDWFLFYFIWTKGLTQPNKPEADKNVANIKKMCKCVIRC